MKSLFKLIAHIFNILWKSLNFARLLLVNIVLLLLVIAIIFGFKTTPSSAPDLLEPTALVLNLNGSLVEQEQQLNPMTEITSELTGDERTIEINVHQLIHTIHYAQTDSNISGLILDLSDLSSTGLTKLRMVGQALKDFRQSNKPIVAIGDYYSQEQYYLASFADDILLNPQGGVLVRGLAAENLYFKDALSKLMITTHVFRVGTHKSFVEPYTRSQMSPEAREDLSRWMDQLWQAYIADVASNRNISHEALAPSAESLIERLKDVQGDGAKYALANGLVDTLATRSQQQQKLIELFAIPDQSETFPSINYDRYMTIIPSLYTEHNGHDQIALLVAQGPIVTGHGTGKVIAAETLIDQLDTVLKDDAIKALVLRVDSPGGSAFASEIIRSKLADIQTAGKPVVISMASVAASGGYWISATSDQIFASPTTITGSIGIFGMFATFEEAMAKFGIHSDGVATTEYASMSPFKALPDDLATIIQLNIENGYHQFIDLVSQGRGQSSQALDKIAQGRIWTGQDAVNNGLVDQLGNLSDALTYAAQKLELKAYDVTLIRPQLSTRDQLLTQLFESETAIRFQHNIPFWSEISQLINKIPMPQLFSDPQGRYLLCESCNTL